MKGGMMHYPLTLTHFVERAGRLFGQKEVVTAFEDGLTRHSWAEILDRTRRVASVLERMGVGQGDRVATLAWNTHRHLELYFGVPAIGAVLHTVNVRLASGQLEQILGHGGARALFVDPDLTEAVSEDVLDRLGVEHRVVLSAEHRPGWTSYEELLADVEPASAFPTLDEDTAAGLCYTSGTTGEPKGVLYSHRALALHAMAISLPDGFGLGEKDTILPAVPMFHANAWGLPHAAAMTGAKLVLPGSRPTPGRVAGLLASEGVTFAAGVPTVWMGVLDELRAGERLRDGLRIHSGGAPSAPSLIEAYREEFDVEIVTGWGMTELSPVGMATHPRAHMADWPADQLLPVQTSQGTPLPFLEARIVGDSGTLSPHDGMSPGELEVRGPWVTAGYFERSAEEAFRDGWLRTGDVATIDSDGYVRLVDRTKDLIRSGGEWISSVLLEHALMNQADVAEAAVVAVADDKWQERPWACVVPRDGSELDVATLLAPLAEAFPKWWVPDGVLFLDALPRTATGKFDKKSLRQRLSTDAAS
jgi:acyl-CoA synthetase (AMP-forming)/AMP-acid ligase II